MTREFLTVISMLVLVVSMFSMVAYAAPQPNDMVVNATFEDGKLDGWDPQGIVKIVEVPGGSGKCVYMEKTEAGGNAVTSILKKFDNRLESTVTIEFRMMTDARLRTKEVSIYNSDIGSEGNIPSKILRISFISGNIRVMQPSGADPLILLKPFEVNQWYQFKVVIDTKKSKADVYLDGKLLVEQTDTEVPAKDIAAIGAMLVGVPEQTVHIDDIMVYQEESVTKSPKAEAPKAEAPKVEAPKAEAPKVEAPKAEAPKAEAPKVGTPKSEVAKNPKTGDSGMMIYGLLLVSAIGTLVTIKKRKHYQN